MRDMSAAEYKAPDSTMTTTTGESLRDFMNDFILRWVYQMRNAIKTAKTQYLL